MRVAQRYSPILLMGALILGSTTAAIAQDRNQSSRPGVADMLEQVTPAVVNIAVTGYEELPDNPLLNDPFFRRFFNVPEQQQQQPQQRQMCIRDRSCSVTLISSALLMT